MDLIIVLLMACIGAAILFIAVKITIWIETPVIVKSGITANKKYIAAINSITNTVFNSVLLVFLFFSLFRGTTLPIVWSVLGELILIPLVEILAYKKVSKVPLKRIIIFTYIANFLSFAAGLIIGYFVQGIR